MMFAMREEEIIIPGEWILGYRPKMFMDKFPDYYMANASKIKRFYTELPSYVNNYTDFNCGHMATHYAANIYEADEIHLYGFDSLFDQDLRSCTDFYLNSDRDASNMFRLNENWRPIWSSMFSEFIGVNFVLHAKHAKIKIQTTPNVTIEVHK